MRVSTAVVLATGLLAANAAADVKVTRHGTRMDIAVSKATVAEILDTISKETGMKVIFDGPRPPREITKSVADRTPADAVLGILEGEGLNFAVILNPAGTQIETLLVTGPAPVKPAPAGAGPASGSGASQPEWAVDVDVPPPPPPPPGGLDDGAVAPPPAGNGDAAQAANAQGTPTPQPPVLPTPTPPPASSFTPTGAGPIIIPTPPSPYQ
jgi:hypothetical protein